MDRVPVSMVSMFERSRLVLIGLSILPLVLASLASAGIVNSTLIGLIVKQAPEYTPLQLLVQAIVSIMLSTLVLFSMFVVLNRRGHGAKKLMVSLMISPILFFVSLFIGQAFLIILFKGTSSPLVGLILTLSLGVSLLSIVLIVIDAFPGFFRSFFAAFYGTIFGIFMGVTIVTSSMIVLVLSLIIEDYFLTRHFVVAPIPTMSGRIGEDPFDYTRIQSRTSIVGVGDYIAFSLIAAHAFIYFPWYVWAMSMVLACVGILINIFIFAEEGKILPSIPLPSFMAIFPWIVHLGYLALLT